MSSEQALEIILSSTLVIDNKKGIPFAIKKVIDWRNASIDWEEVFDNAQTMHQQEFINYYKTKK